jgi:hypothetical protein
VPVTATGQLSCSCFEAQKLRFQRRGPLRCAPWSFPAWVLKSSLHRFPSASAPAADPIPGTGLSVPNSWTGMADVAEFFF